MTSSAWHLASANLGHPSLISHFPFYSNTLGRTDSNVHLDLFAQQVSPQETTRDHKETSRRTGARRTETTLREQRRNGLKHKACPVLFIHFEWSSPPTHFCHHSMNLRQCRLAQLIICSYKRKHTKQYLETLQIQTNRQKLESGAFHGVASHSLQNA